MTIMPESSIYKSLIYLERSGQFYSQKFTLFKKNAIMTSFQLEWVGAIVNPGQI